MKVRFLERHSRIKEALRWLAAITIIVGAFLLLFLFPDAFTNPDAWRPIMGPPDFSTLPITGGLNG